VFDFFPRTLFFDRLVKTELAGLQDFAIYFIEVGYAAVIAEILHGDLIGLESLSALCGQFLRYSQGLGCTSRQRRRSGPVHRNAPGCHGQARRLRRPAPSPFAPWYGLIAILLGRKRRGDILPQGLCSGDCWFERCENFCTILLDIRHPLYMMCCFEIGHAVLSNAFLPRL
jgi:hypothetical protein